MGRLYKRVFYNGFSFPLSRGIEILPDTLFYNLSKCMYGGMAFIFKVVIFCDRLPLLYLFIKARR